MNDSILIIEDEALLGSELQRYYARMGFETLLAADCAQAREILSNPDLRPSLILSDLSLPDGSGLDLLEETRGNLSDSEWVFLTGYGDVPDSVRALRLGAFDFLIKPCLQEQLDMVVRSALRSAKAQRRILTDSVNAGKRYAPETFLGNSPVTRQTGDMLRQLSQVPYSALILTGETGTGKGLAARILHYNSERAKEPLVELNCAALPKDLLESELFGHEAGAFTGAKARHRGLIEQAHRGTLFLDEIGEMPLDLQAKLLKVLEDRKLRRLGGEKEIDVDIRVIAATNRNLQDEVKNGGFRSDLYYRLSVFELRLPSLCERIGDLDDLVPALIAEFNLLAGKRVSQVSPRAWQLLKRYRWPGNVRELRNVLERSVILSSSQQLPEQWLPNEDNGVAAIAQESVRPACVSDVSAADGLVARLELQFPTDGSMGLEDMESEIVRNMLDLCHGNVMEAARILKTTREKIRYRIEKYKLR
ncbi:MULTISPECIES: sigma-54-dependent transcriptional regulator [Methylomonas]|uniref:Sigma-54-dependent Fis family transcriptional regulator n=1 Tax=Methylomonas koyamae TaxID=702114 RepID=A0A177N5W7_9GAMM|nr:MULTISPECIES: sigma-54 dependent transcriptional regulator [Methylomonas]OAI12863.1 sigma-54-dependent Fis family transcriptional regulator [Methylomonas koyamae]OHX35181.1 sigma-54-dependent Fis family transcriptional regulator [Methylomonas sp. LWB]